jgi:hypothetical protein
MRAIQGIAWLVLVLMTVNMANVAVYSGMNHGVGLDVFLTGSKEPWQNFIDDDLVTGLLFTCSWIIFRERGGRPFDTVIWIWLVVWWGNIVVAAYVLFAVRQSGGDWSRFFMGRHAPGRTVEPAVLLSLPLRLAAAAGGIASAAYLLASLAAIGFSGIAAFGYIAGFLPVVIAFFLVAAEGGVLLDRRRTA